MSYKFVGENRVTTHTVGVSEYDNARLEAWIKAGIRKSKASIVAEGIIAIASRLNYEADALETAKERVKEQKEEMAEARGEVKSDDDSGEDFEMEEDDDDE